MNATTQQQKTPRQIVADNRAYILTHLAAVTCATQQELAREARAQCIPPVAGTYDWHAFIGQLIFDGTLCTDPQADETGDERRWFNSATFRR